MRISKLRDYLEEVLKLKPAFGVTIDHEHVNGTYYVTGLNSLRLIVATLSEYPGGNFLGKGFAELDVAERVEDRLGLSRESRDQLRNFTNALYSQLAGLFAVLRDALPPSSEESIRFKLPVSEDPDTVIKDVSAVFRALRHVVLDPEIGGELRIKGWENGSLWLDIWLGASSVVAFVGSIAWSAAVIRRKWAEGQIMIEKAREIGAEADVVEHLSEALKKSIDVVIETEAQNVLSRHGKGKTGQEFLERLKLTIKEFYELMARGAEIQPSLMEPTKASELFPDFTKLNTISSKVLGIEDSPSESGESQKAE